MQRVREKKGVWHDFETKTLLEQIDIERPSIMEYLEPFIGGFICPEMCPFFDGIMTVRPKRNRKLKRRGMGSKRSLRKA